MQEIVQHYFCTPGKKVELSTEEGLLVLLNEDIKDGFQHSGDLVYLSMPYLECKHLNMVPGLFIL